MMGLGDGLRFWPWVMGLGYWLGSWATRLREDGGGERALLLRVEERAEVRLGA